MLAKALLCMTPQARLLVLAGSALVLCKHGVCAWVEESLVVDHALLRKHPECIVPDGLAVAARGVGIRV